MSTSEGAATGAARGGLAAQSAGFLDYLDRFLAELPARSLEDVVVRAGGPQGVALVAVDVVNGFCTSGPLASARVGAIVPGIEALFRAAYDAGVRAMAVLRDSHDPQAPEFAQFGPHCLAGSAESALVEPLSRLPFVSSLADVPKNATSAWTGATHFPAWVAEQERAGVGTFIVVGDCTDLCVYQTAMPLKLGANARNRPLEVIVPAEGVDTYDLPEDTARSLGAMPHPGDLLHAVFLYHLQLNGVQVVRRLTTL
jgi:nicotinamidase-related amidase